jgi:hypothetical protein
MIKPKKSGDNFGSETNGFKVVSVWVQNRRLCLEMARFNLEMP